MNLERFADLLDIHGADIAAWPAGDIPAATALLAASADARALQHQALALEATLGRAVLPDLEPDAALRARVLALAGTAPAAAAVPDWRSQVREAFALLFPRGHAMPQFATLALALAIGIGAGMSNFVMTDTQETDLLAVQLASALPIPSED